MEIGEVKKEIAGIVLKELNGLPYQAFFFGSRVSGKSTPTSDLDVGIMGEKLLPVDIFYKIKSQCDAMRTLYTIDVVDFSNTSEEFKKIALRHIEKII